MINVEVFGFKKGGNEMSCEINIKNRINSDTYDRAVRTVYTPNKGPATVEIMLPEGCALNSANAFFKNNGEVLKQAILKLGAES